jgi:hypothetical protein
MTTIPPSYNKAMEVEKLVARTNDADYDYWTKAYAPAVEFAKVCVTPDMDDGRKQDILLATLNTLQKWTKAE